jgi:signal transduction histidine kinase
MQALVALGTPGSTIACTTTLAAGLARLALGECELVILDLDLPDGQGISSIAAVLAEAPDIPLIVVTGSSDEAQAIAAMHAGAQDYLVKGHVDSATLWRAMRYTIERKRTEMRVREHQTQLRSLAAEISLAEERERRRIALDLHDHVGQLLALSRMKIDGFLAQDGVPVPASALHALRDWINDAVAYTRTLTTELSPPVLYDLGLEAAIRWLAEQVEERHALPVMVEDDAQHHPVADEMRGLLFRAVRELLLNVVKHAGATQVRIMVRKSPDGISITVHDDGVGFPAVPAHGLLGARYGFGLFTLRERLQYVGGSLTVHSTPGEGASVTIIAPLYC